MNAHSLWDRFAAHLLRYEDLGFTLDISRMRFADDFFEVMEPKAQAAFAAMQALEGGAIANPDENRMVGHYWLRTPSLAPTAELLKVIQETKAEISLFAAAVHSGNVSAPGGKKFTDVLVVGIGGSALGPQFVADALGSAANPIQMHFLDNTDPDGMDRLFDELSDRLCTTLVVVISKSGGTKETRNGMVETQAAFEERGLDFAKHAVAVTGEGSDLDKVAAGAGWLKRFPMWDWVGGRTSIMSAVGLLPMALQGLDIDAFLSGAAAMDAKTRVPHTRDNAAMKLALMWYYATEGQGKKDMVLLPYKDRLVLFSKYLQQLVMESIGKQLDLDGKKVNQGLTVYGNKGSTDQHAYVQQLRDGVANFFVTFVEVRKGRDGQPMQVEPGVTSADYLQGFLRGTRTALYEGGRDSMTISIPEVSAFQVGLLVALYERAVGFYATLVNINAYHQPGVEAGKKAASVVLALQRQVRQALGAQPQNASQIAAEIQADPEAVFHVLTHLAANDRGVKRETGATAQDDRFSATA
jgi:glucose-6-phosphate isomerase